MTLLTAIEIANNYPENIKIDTAKQENEKYSGFLYRTKGKDIHKLLISTAPDFDTAESASSALNDLSVECKNRFSE